MAAARSGQAEVILTSSGGLLRVARLDPPDFETATPEALIAHHGRIAGALARYGNGWSIWIDQWRSRATAIWRSATSAAAMRRSWSRRAGANSSPASTSRSSPTPASSPSLQPQAKEALLHWMMDRQGSQMQGNIRLSRKLQQPVRQLATAFAASRSCGVIRWRAIWQPRSPISPADPLSIRCHRPWPRDQGVAPGRSLADRRPRSGNGRGA